MADPPGGEQQESDRVVDAETGLRTLNSRDDPREAEWFDGPSRKVLKVIKTDLNDVEVVAGFAEIVRRGLFELQNRM